MPEGWVHERDDEGMDGGVITVTEEHEGRGYWDHNNDMLPQDEPAYWEADYSGGEKEDELQSIDPVWRRGT